MGRCIVGLGGIGGGIGQSENAGNGALKSFYPVRFREEQAAIYCFDWTCNRFKHCRSISLEGNLDPQVF